MRDGSIALLLSLAFFFAGGILRAAQPEPDAPVWTVKMTETDEEHRISFESPTLFVDLLKEHFWTIRNIRHEGDVIVGEYGANGTVVNATAAPDAASDDPWIGTGHGKETVHSLTILVDGKEHAYKPGSTLHGQTIVIRKKSNLGPLDHEAELTFPSSGDRILERHAYKVIEDLDDRFNFVYAFMHCNDNALDQWLAVTGEGSDLQGRVGKQDNQFSLHHDARAVIFYSEELQKGVVYAYPKAYEGEGNFKNSIWDRKRDNKLYFKPVVKGKYDLGDTFEFRVEVIPFSAAPDEWMTKAKELSQP